MRSKTEAFSKLMLARIQQLAQREPDKWLNARGEPSYTAIAGMMTIALGHYYHPMAVSRLLKLQRGDLTRPEVRAWIQVVGWADDLAKAARAWHDAGLLPPGTTPAQVRQLLDQRETSLVATDPHREIRTRTSYEPAGARILAFPSALVPALVDKVPTRPVAKVA